MNLSIVSINSENLFYSFKIIVMKIPILSELNLLMLEHIRRFKVFEKEYTYYVTRTLILQSKEAQFLTECAMKHIKNI